jgi:hypothetical protein
MTIKWIGLSVVAAVFMSGCSMFGKNHVKGSPEARTEVLRDGEKEISDAETRYRGIVLKHGESSKEAVDAKTEWNAAKNKYAANQTHVEQLQRMDAAPREAVDPKAPTSGNMYPSQQ